MTIETKEIFGISGQEEILARLEAESEEDKPDLADIEEAKALARADDYIDMSGSGGPSDDR